MCLSTSTRDVHGKWGKNAHHDELLDHSEFCERCWLDGNMCARLRHVRMFEGIKSWQLNSASNILRACGLLLVHLSA